MSSSRTIIYLSGKLSSNGTRINLTLPSAAVILLVHYCDLDLFELVFVNDELDCSYCMTVSFAVLLNTKHTFISRSESRYHCDLPGVTDGCIIRSGLCSTLRCMIKKTHDSDPNKHIKDLLGFRCGSLKACAEVSGWTKLCEVELPMSISELIKEIRSLNFEEEGESRIALPEDLMKLEWHFDKPAPVHNDDKKKRSLLSQIKNEMAGLKEVSEFCYIREIPNPHGSSKVQICDNCNRGSNHDRNNPCSDRIIKLKPATMTELEEFVSSLTIHNLDFMHIYSEGMEITISDLILFTYVYFLLESVSFDISVLEEHLPHITCWFRHMMTLPNVNCAADKSQFELRRINDAIEMCGKLKFYVADGVKPPTDDDMELSRRLRGKYRAIKPDITRAMDKVKEGNIDVVVGKHPRQGKVQLDWESFPASVDPGIDLPKKRHQRKCQQLENLVTAVLEIYRHGDVIVDFCSGGGHLGIVLAYLLPDCKVYLVENNEDSLLRAKVRVEDLKLLNVTLYQCNQDYFHERFNIGICLHACGVATDMVLKQCIENQANFVICPCCYGGIQNTHLITYPRSRLYKEANIEYKEFLTLGHVADQTEFNMALEEQGKYCMNLVDTDRLHLAKEHGYSTTLCSLHPLSCTPKNNLLIGQITKS